VGLFYCPITGLLSAFAGKVSTNAQTRFVGHSKALQGKALQSRIGKARERSGRTGELTIGKSDKINA